MRAAHIVALFTLWTVSVAAHDVTRPAEGVALEQHPGAPIPAALAFVDDLGRAITFGGALHGKPAVVVLGYATCEDLCPLTLQGAARALRDGGLVAGRDYEALFVSVDPRDGPEALSQARRRDLPGADRVAWTFLSGADAGRLAQALGFRFRHDVDPEAIAHAAGLVVVTARPAVSRYFPGVRFEPRSLRLALAEAAQGHIGDVVDRLVLLCSHFDPATGRYTVTVLAALDAAIAAFLVLAALFAWWRLRKAQAA